MPLTTVPSTELDAVNVIIGTMGEAPVSSLEGEVTDDVGSAMGVLTEVSRAVQSEAWEFNRELEQGFVPNEVGEIVLPDTVLRFELSRRRHPTKKVTQRGARLYDRVEHTYIFTETIHGEIVVFLDFSELPEAARRYITVRAARVYLDRYGSGAEVHGFTEADERFARAILGSAEMDTQRYSALDSYPPRLWRF